MNRLKNVTLLLLLSTLGGCGEDPQEAGIADVRPELGVEGSSPAILELRVTTDLPDDYVFEFEGDVAGHPYMEVSTVPGVTDPFETLQGTYTLQPVHATSYNSKSVGS